MVWLVVLGLLAWVLFLAVQSSELKAQVRVLQLRLADLSERFENSRTEVSIPAQRAERQAPVAAADLPRAAAAAVSAQAAATAPVRETAATAAPKRAGPPPRERAAAWLSENGLAWLGGGVLALGGMFMVAYAAERGFFSPAMRIATAVALGVALLGLSEWLRRQAGKAPAQALAAAVTAGAGAATLYAAAWASYWLYSFIGLGAVGGLLAVISLGLLALATRHGEPLAMLAIGGALLAPAVTGPQHWDAPALTAYLALAMITGYAAAGARRWGLAGATTLLGAVLWALAGYAAEGYVRVAALSVGPLALAITAVEWRRRRPADEAPQGSAESLDLFRRMPHTALIAAAVVLAGLWVVKLKGPDLAWATLAEALLMGLAVFAARRRLVPAGLQLAGYISAALAAMAILNGAPSQSLELAGAALALVAAASGVWAASEARTEIDQFCAAGGAVTALLLSLTISGPLTAHAPFAPAGLCALLLAGCSVLVARRTEAPSRNVPLALWLWSGAAALLMALKIASDAQVLPLVVAVTAVGFAMLEVRVGWRGFAGAAIACALASLAALLNPDLLRAVFGSHQWPFRLALVGAASAAVILGASRLIRARDRTAPAADSLTTAAILVALTAVTLLLRFWGASETADGGWRLDVFAEAGLRTVTILAAGVLSTMAVRGDSHPIGRWRGHVLLIAGLVHTLFVQALLVNPLWAWWTPAVSGPPLLDSLALGFLAPALLLAAATTRRVSNQRQLTAIYATAAFGLGLLWAAMEIRRLFQSASLHLGVEPIGRAEAAAYALLALAAARALFAAAARAERNGWGLGEAANTIRSVGRGAAWIAFIYAVLAYGLLASPWWGPIRRPIDSNGAAALLFGLYAAGALVALWIVRAVKEDDALLARVGRITAVIVVFALLNLLTRWSFRGLDMRPVREKASIETWAFSAVWGLYGFGLLVFATARREADLRWAGLLVLLAATAKVFLFDMAKLEGVVRAASFLAVGGLLLAAAVIARRLSGGRLSAS